MHAPSPSVWEALSTLSTPGTLDHCDLINCHTHILATWNHCFLATGLVPRWSSEVLEDTVFVVTMMPQLQQQSRGKLDENGEEILMEGICDCKGVYLQFFLSALAVSVVSVVSLLVLAPIISWRLFTEKLWIHLCTKLRGAESCWELWRVCSGSEKRDDCRC